MKKTTIIIVLATLCINFSVLGQSVQHNKLVGIILDSNGKPVHNANIFSRATNKSVNSDKDGVFAINTTSKNDVLTVSYVGFRTEKIQFDINKNPGPFKVSLASDDNSLNEVVVMSTGYQNIPKERATGSFVEIGKEQLNRNTSANILDRLNGVTSGLLFSGNKQDPNSSNISIRGRSTLFANDQPLIVLDNFPYEGDINNINPNDIASITILKDAAAASIWGVKAGNGVIVITSKKGGRNSPLKVSLTSNVTISSKPNLYYTPQMTSSEYVDFEKYLFNQGYYFNLGDGYSSISPAIAVLLSKQEGKLTEQETGEKLALLTKNDIRRDLKKYIYRSPVNQQYQANVSGGGSNNSFYVSAGWDQLQQNIVSNDFSRFTVNANNNYSLFGNYVDWTSGILITKSTTKFNTNSFLATTPYEMLKDASGNNLSIVKNLRSSYIDTAGKGKLLNWQYVPLSENSWNQKTDLTDYRVSNQLSIKLIPSLKIVASYVYEKGLTDILQNNSSDSFYTRNLINTYSQIDPISGAVTRIIPYGNIVYIDNSRYSINTGRIQINFEHFFGNSHSFNAVGGYEASDYQSFRNSHTLYGYNPVTAANANQSLDFGKYFPQFFGYDTGQIPAGTTSLGTIDRNRSYYANISYNYKGRYTISVSGRKDESNIFGVTANKKGVPLWSSGISWRISDEPFFKWTELSMLSLRATYGYNGNTDKSATAYLTTATLPGGVNFFNSPYLFITNPPNPSLSWEKVGVTNLGIDFSLKNGFLSGSVEYYNKRSFNLIANSPISPQTGVSQFKGNAANMKTQGLEVSLNARLAKSAIKWEALILFNYAKNEVTQYKLATGSNYNIVQSNYLNPLVGYPIYSIFSFPAIKLDDLGNPRGYLDGEISADYQSMLNSTNTDNLVYNGSAIPLYFGSIINNFNYGQFSLSIGIGYKLDYYFRKPSLNYTSLFSGIYQQADFSKRWQAPGDENHTHVPSMIYYNDPQRDSFYTYSNTLVDRADNIRLQDVKIGYSFKSRQLNALNLKSLQIYTYANNLAILWRANRDGLDPDSPFNPPTSRSISFGLNASF